MNSTIVPTLSQQNSKHRFINQIEAWKNFAQRITKNPFVKQYLLYRDGHDCTWCKKELIEPAIIHHISYDHTCSYNIVQRIWTPTKKNPHKTRLIPDCANCKKENKQRFLECMQKLSLVHNSCNKKIADVANATKLEMV